MGPDFYQFLSGVIKCSKIHCGVSCMTVNILKTLYTLNWYILWYVKYISIKLFLKNCETGIIIFILQTREANLRDTASIAEIKKTRSVDPKYQVFKPYPTAF